MVIRGFHTELETVYEEYNMGLTNDFEKAYNALNYKLYPGHPYGTQTIIGTQEHLKIRQSLTLRNILSVITFPTMWQSVCQATSILTR